MLLVECLKQCCACESCENLGYTTIHNTNEMITGNINND